MAEHVCELTPMDSETWETTIGVEVVRCRDCRFSIAGGFGCGKWSDFENVHPKGFCAWGERRVVE